MPYSFTIRRMASSCSWAAFTTLSAFAESQFTRRVMVFRMSFSTLAVMMPMAALVAPMVVKKSAMASACLKYSREFPLRSASLGLKPISISTE